MAGTTLDGLLQQFSLEKYYDAFISVGIDDSVSLLSLTMQDYPALGITSMQDRRKMFHLIQNVKENNHCTNMSYRKDRSTSSTSTDHHLGKKKSKELEETHQAITVFESTQPKKFHRENTSHDFSYGIPSSKLKPKTPVKHKAFNENSKIKVCVRKRPLDREEFESGETDVVDTLLDKKMVVISAPKVAVDLTKYMQKFSFVFDEVFDETLTNWQIYEKTCKPLVNEIFSKGIKATCFAYGCTGSGKTYTMLGTDNVPGLYLLAASDIFSILYSNNHGNGLGLWVSFYEIYCGQLYDLLNERSKLFARENAAHHVCIAGLTEKHVNNVEELMEVIESGGNSRSTGSTGVNADSSRSHAILQLDLKANECGETLGRFSFIDLAGSERAADVTDSDKQTRMEGAEINQSLLALKECIRALDQDLRHTPFRQSKLTQVLKDSFVGNTQTCMIANISPCSSSSENTLNTLRYSDRVKELNKNEVVMNLSPRPVTVLGDGSDKWPEVQQYTSKSTNKSVKIKDHQPSKLNLGKSKETSPDQLNVVPNNRLNINQIQLENIRKNRPKTTNTTPQIKTNKTKNGRCTVFKSLEPLSSRTLKNTPEKTRPDTSPADINVTSQNKSRFTKKLHCVVKEQPYNLLKTKEQSSIEKTEEKPKKQTFNLRLSEQRSINRASSSEEVFKREAKVNQNMYKSTSMSNVSEERPKRQAKSRLSEKRNFNRVRKTSSSEEVYQQEVPVNQNIHKSTSVSNISEERPKRQAKSRLLEQRNFNLVNKTSSSDHEEVLKNEAPATDTSALQKHNTIKSSCHPSQHEENVGHNLPSALQKTCHYEQHIDTLPQPDKSDGTPLSNNRYSKGIKARLAQLFNGKSTAGSELLPDCKQTVTLSSGRSKRALQPVQQVTPRVRTEEQIVAAHHTQLAMVTGLCHEEMILLKERDNNKQDFKEYAFQLEEILLQKQACIETLQQKLKAWKTTQS